MTGYIIQPNTWKTVKAIQISAYSLPLECDLGQEGTVTAIGELDFKLDNMFLILDFVDGRFYRINSYTYANGVINFKLSTMEDALSYVVAAASDNESAYIEKLNDRWLMWTFGLVSKSSRGKYYEVLYGQGTGNKYLPYQVAIGAFRATSILPGGSILDNFIPEDVSSAISAANIPLSEFGIGPSVRKRNTGEVIAGPRGYTVYSNVEVNRILNILARLGVGMSFEKVPIGQPLTPDPFWKKIGEAIKITLKLVYDTNTVENVVVGDGHTELLSESYNNDVVTCVYGYRANPSGTYGQILPPIMRYLDATMNITEYEVDQAPGGTAYVEATTSNIDAKAAEIFANNEWKHRIEFASDNRYYYGQKVKLRLPSSILETTISKVEIRSDDNRFFYTCGELPTTASQQIKSNSWSFGRRLPLNPYKGQLVFM